MSRVTAVFFALACLLLLTWIGAWLTRGTVQTDLVQRVQHALGSHAITDLNVSADGRDLRISGELVRAVSPERVAEIAAAVWGVRVVDIEQLAQQMSPRDPDDPLNPRLDAKRIVRLGGDLSNPMGAGTCQRTMARLAASGRVLFAAGSASPSLESYPVLNDLASVAYQCPQTYLIIGGHTDGTGDREASLRLSQARAEAIEQFFYVAGIPRERLRVAAYGDSQPIASNATSEGRAANRRITFAVRPFD